VPPDRAFELLVMWRGNAAAVHRQLIAEAIAVPGVRTLRRAIAREVSLAQRDYITDGDDGVRARTVHLRHEARFRGECYEGDHKQLSIEVLAPRATRAQRPWATLFIDQFSRLIVGWALSLQPTAAEVLAAVRGWPSWRIPSGRSAACRSACAGITAMSSVLTPSSRPAGCWAA